MREFTAQDTQQLEEDELGDIVCPFCKEAGYGVKLGGKMLEANEPRPEDYQNWLQYGKCYWLCPFMKRKRKQQ